eukprot:GILJ01009379.1.p1 GENE.GILJ01009379.1~~GILJ01009379.1.p1  ORF type:complete len:313 (-),score=19.96 GILJ01009379.1:53-991(-)
MSEESNFRQATTSFVAGGIAGAVAKSAVAPLERVKILFQVSSERFSFPRAYKELFRIIHEEGIHALWKGNSAMMARIMPYAALQYMTFDQYKRLLRPSDSQSEDVGKVRRFIAGSMAGATSVLFTYPLDLMRARLAVQTTVRRYHGLGHAFVTMYKEEGYRGFTRGMFPTLVGIVPYGGLSFFTYETMKLLALEESKKDGKALPSWKRFLFGALAGAVAQSATYPLDVVRRRMQTESFIKTLQAQQQGRAVVHVLQRSMTDIFIHIMHTEGIRGLFKGLTLNWIKGPIAVGISFTTFDFMKMLMAVDEFQPQ